jgi:PBP1b-binding outer membrane lipoprotein LpoB
LRSGFFPFLNSIKGILLMKKDPVCLVSVLLLALMLASCGSTPAAPSAIVTGNTPSQATDTVSNISSPTETALAPSPTSDPCSTKQIEADVQKVHSHMREFDDASLLASNLPREQLNDSIANLQKIRREAEDEQIPACLTNLKKYEVDHMNTVINTMVGFMGGASRDALEQGISVARQQHDQYTLELARLLGLTVVPATESAGSQAAGTATP